MKLILTYSQTIGGELYEYHAEAITEGVMDTKLLVEQFEGIKTELQAMAADDRKKIKGYFDWPRIIDGQN